MHQIIFIAPTADLLEVVLRVCKKLFPQVHALQGLIGEGVRLALHHSRRGTSVFVSRGRTASAIRAAAIPDCIVVETPVTAYDYMRALKRAEHMGDRPAVVVFQEMAEPVSLVNDFCRPGARLYLPASEEDTERQVKAALQDGADVLVGGATACREAERLGLPAVQIQTGEEAVLQALREACRILEARTMDKVKNAFLRAAIEQNSAGVFVVDAALRVTMYSPPARQDEKSPGSSALIGKTLKEVWPELNLRGLLGGARRVREELAVFNGREVRYRLERIRAGDQEAGLVLSFNDAGESIPALDKNGSTQNGLQSFDYIIGSSTTMRRTIRTAKDYALTEAPLLISGEPGSGKTLFAESIHAYSRRAGGPFVTVPCALLSPQLLEAYFLGSGAPDGESPGVFEAARSGTLFFDEIADLDGHAQSLILDVLRSKVVRRTGSRSAVPVDLRIMAGTARDLAQRIRQGLFRAELYYALNVLHLHIPALHERTEDIAALAGRRLQAVARPGQGQTRFSADALLLLRRHFWAGNVRELYNIVERAAATSHVDLIEKKHLEDILRVNEPSVSLARELLRNDAIDSIRKAMLESGGRQREAAAKLGIDRSTLWRRMKKLGLR
ncbi:MAG: sigma 54-interacting transcriptional regulator [Deltaproteobacteria bacterium]|nr:sigma 54-interacting transcriptional regulator [Deltaproteobacteria bacterium]